ncbi:MAG: hypothetical protein INR64_16225 [Caulobacteraceae bacterium]|nr:hypothetical protein [Caulobacter sp.]
MPAATVPAGLIERRLRAVRRRWWARMFVLSGGWFLPCAAVAVLGWGLVRFFEGLPVVDAPAMLAVLVGGPLWLALFATFGLHGTAPSLRPTAAMIDQRARTHDRFLTAVTLAERPSSARTPMEELALAECARFVERFDPRPVLPVRLPRAFWYTPVPLIALATLALYVALGIGEPPRDPALDAAVARRADTLEKIADRLRQDPGKNPSELDKVADEMKKSAGRLKAGERQTDEERLKSTLKELSSLEAMLNAMKQARQDAKISPGELAALAAALAASEPARAAAESLKNGRLEQAAGQLEQLLQQLKQQGDASQALQQLAQSMQEQAAKLTESEKNEVARQMEQAAQGAQSGQGQLSQQALQRLAELLRRAGQSGSPSQQQAASGKGGQPMTERQLQDLINSLENMKDGLRPGEGPDGQTPGQPQDGPGEGRESLASVESFGQKASANPSAGDKPSGLPGSEHDSGHPDKLYGDQPAEAAKQGQAKRVEGLLGEGESLQELTAAGGGGPARAGRRYKELYEAMAPAAQESVEQENIPLGSRRYIRRYFENIRPKE